MTSATATSSFFEVAPNPSTGSQPIHDLGTHDQAWEPSSTEGDAADLSTGRRPRGDIHRLDLE